MQSESALAQLESWGITDTFANQAGLFEVPDVSKVFDEMPAKPGIIIPYYDVDGQILQLPLGNQLRPFGRVRWLDKGEPVTGFVKAKPMRYTQPKYTGPQVYFPPMINWREVVDDPRIPIIMTEGEAKALCGALYGFRVVALGGVFSFTTPGGQLLSALENIAWEHRDVFICYDSDAKTNPNVMAAEARLVDELQGKRGAHCRIVRLPGDQAHKIGLDDYLKLRGPDQFEKMLRNAPSLSGLDAKIVSFNRSCAWVEHEGMIWDIEAHRFIKKDNFTNGSRWGAERHITVDGQRGKQKEVSVAEKWLKHPHAQRYDEILFRPSEGQTVIGQHGLPALNMWTGFDNAQHGDVAPWLKLHDYIFSKLDSSLAQFALNLIAYKAQNPHIKVPLSTVLIGSQGSGKTVWMDSIRDAFGPYGKNVTPKSLELDFDEWLEQGLFNTIHEITPDQMRRSSETIKALISDLQRPMNAKFRPARIVNSYAMYGFTSNLRGVGAFAADDRRMFVVDCPDHNYENESMYEEVWNWRNSGGGNFLIDFLLHYDLQGWTPPQKAPMTAEKAISHAESLTPLQQLAEDMRNADINMIVNWLDAAAMWAQNAELGNNPQAAQRARDIVSGLSRWQIRPWYTAQELTMMFPVLVEMMYGSKFAKTTPAGQISRELREAGIPYLVNSDNDRGFVHQGQLKQYLVIADFEEWADPITQNVFDHKMGHWPTYGDIKRNQGVKYV